MTREELKATLEHRQKQRDRTARTLRELRTAPAKPTYANLMNEARQLMEYVHSPRPHDGSDEYFSCCGNADAEAERRSEAEDLATAIYREYETNTHREARENREREDEAHAEEADEETYTSTSEAPYLRGNEAS